MTPPRLVTQPDLPIKVVRSLDGGLVRDRRSALAQMTHDELLALYGARLAKRTYLTDTAIIDLLIWLEAGAGHRE